MTMSVAPATRSPLLRPSIVGPFRHPDRLHCCAGWSRRMLPFPATQYRHRPSSLAWHPLCRRSRNNNLQNSGLRPSPPSRWLSSFTSGFSDFSGSDNPKTGWVMNSDLNPHIRANVSALPPAESEAHHDTGFSFTLLGTGAGLPNLVQGNASSALRMGGVTYLFDAGEGMQLHLLRSRIRVGDVRKIFITHMHADHIFGLPGLLLTLQIVAKAPPPKKKSGRGDPQRRKVVQVYGPVGLYNFIAMSLSLSATVLKHLTVEVFELQGGSSATRWRHPGAIRNYGEFRHPGLWRRSIPQNDDGTWTIEVAEEIETEEDALRVDIERRGMYVTAAELDHVPKLQCFGYVVREATTQPRSIDKDRAIAAGVRPSKKFRILKSGIPVRSDDDTRLVDPKEVLLEDAPRAPRTLALLGDCCTIPEPMHKLCQDVDVLVHEATIGSDQDSGIKVDRGGHSTPSMAGKFANDVNAKVLILNHLSPHLRVRASERALAREAEEQIRGRTRVQVAYDYLELLVPPSGFPW